MSVGFGILVMELSENIEATTNYTIENQNFSMYTPGFIIKEMTFKSFVYLVCG